MNLENFVSITEVTKNTAKYFKGLEADSFFVIKNNKPTAVISDISRFAKYEATHQAVSKIIYPIEEWAEKIDWNAIPEKETDILFMETAYFGDYSEAEVEDVKSVEGINEAFKELSFLKKLDFAGNRKIKDMPNLDNLTTLVEVDMQFTNIESISKLPKNLEVLKLPSGSIGVEEIKNLPRSLSKLYISSKKSQTNSSNTEFQDLDDINLCESQSHNLKRLPNFSNHCSLQEVHLCCNAINEDDLSSIYNYFDDIKVYIDDKPDRRGNL